MKTNFKLTLVMLAGAALVYTGCKKSNSPAPSSTSTQNAAVSQIATNFYQSLVGSYGGVSVSNGLTSPSFVNPNKGGLNLNDNTTCGFYVDNGIDYKTNIGDSIKSETKGSINFQFLCKNGAH